MELTINLGSEEFEIFYRALSNLNEICNDADIRGGLLRQRTNSQTAIFEVDFSPLIQQADLPISNLKEKLNLLKMFSGQETKLEITDRKVCFSDQYSRLEFEKPHLEFMDNKFMTDDEFNGVVQIRDDDLLFDVDLQDIIATRIKVVSQTFNVTSIQVNFHGENASLSAATQAKDQYAKFIDGIIMNTPTEGKFSNITAIALTVDHDEIMNLKSYQDTESTAWYVMKTSLGGSVNITTYARSSLIAERPVTEDSPF